MFRLSTVIQCALCTLGHSLDFFEYVLLDTLSCVLWTRVQHNPHYEMFFCMQIIIAFRDGKIPKSYIYSFRICLCGIATINVQISCLYYRAKSLGCSDTWLHASQCVQWLGRERTKQLEACGAHWTGQQRVSVQIKHHISLCPCWTCKRVED